MNGIQAVLLIIRIVLGCTLIVMLGLIGYRTGGLFLGLAGAGLGAVAADQWDQRVTR